MCSTVFHSADGSEPGHKTAFLYMDSHMEFIKVMVVFYGKTGIGECR